MTFAWDAAKYRSSSNLQKIIGHELLDNIQIKKTDCILDAGCGVGDLTLEIACKAEKGYVIGIDSSDSMIEKCIETAQENNIKNVNFLTLSVTDIIFEDKFDIIFSNSVLHWVKEIGKTLNVFLKALKPGGFIALQFPLLNSSHPLVYITRIVIDTLDLHEFYRMWEFPWYVTTEEEFRSLMINMNYCNIKIYKKETTFKFNSVEKAYEFFELIGLNIYLNKLSQDRIELFKEEFIRNIQSLSIEECVELKFERIFAFARRNK